MSEDREKTRLVFRVLGPKIMKCVQLIALIERLIERYKLNAEIVHEENPEDIKIENFADLPLMLINGRVLLKGRVPGEKELVRLINRMLPANENIEYIEGPKPKKKFKINWTMVVFFVAVIVYLITKISWRTGVKTNIPMNMKDSIQQEYNYEKNGKDFQFTFIEFGADNSKSCKQMEPVLDEIQAQYKGKINYIYVDVTDSTNDSISDYYNISLIPVHLILDREAQEFYRGFGYITFDSLSNVINLKTE